MRMHSFALALAASALSLAPVVWAEPFPSEAAIAVMKKAFVEANQNGVNAYGVLRLKRPATLLDGLNDMDLAEARARHAQGKDSVLPLNRDAEIVVRSDVPVIEYREENGTVVAVLEKEDSVEFLSDTVWSPIRVERHRDVVAKSDINAAYIADANRLAGLARASWHGIKPLSSMGEARAQEHFLNRIFLAPTDLARAAGAVGTEAEKILENAAIRYNPVEEAVIRGVLAPMAGTTGVFLASIMIANPAAYFLALALDDSKLSLSEMIALPFEMIIDSIQSILTYHDFERSYVKRVTEEALASMLLDREMGEFVVSGMTLDSKGRAVSSYASQTTKFRDHYGRIAESGFGNDGKLNWFATYKRDGNSVTSVVFHREQRVRQDGAWVTVYVAYPQVKSWGGRNHPMGHEPGQTSTMVIMDAQP